MTISTRRRGGVTLLELEGKLLVGRGDVALREAVESLLSAGESRIVLPGRFPRENLPEQPDFLTAAQRYLG